MFKENKYHFPEVGNPKALLYRDDNAIFSEMTVWKVFLTIIISLFFSSAAHAEVMIRDSEIENVIKEAINPIVKAAAVGKVDLVLIQSPDVNAFTSGGNDIYIYSGLISQFPDADIFKGVIAHELGHVAGHHVSRQMENMVNQSKAALAGVAIGIAGALASSDPGAIIAGAIGGTDFAEKNILKYSRTYESSADQAAFKILEKSGNSAIGLKKLLEFFSKEQRSISVNPYLLSHPLSTERLSNVSDFLNHSKYKTSTTPSSMQRKFKRVSYKTLAFTTSDPEGLLQKSLEFRDAEIESYVKAICYMRLGNYAKSISAINLLLAKNPNDPYYNELKGQILFEFGKKESLSYFMKAGELLPNDALMKLNIAVVSLNVNREKPAELSKFIPYLKFVQQQEPLSLAPYYYLSLYYEALGDTPLSQVYLAVYYNKQGSPQAKQLAKSALKGLKAETPEWYWAKDIVDEEK